MQTTIGGTTMEYINTWLHSNIKSNDEKLLNYTKEACINNAHIEQVHGIVRSNCCLTVWEIAEECNVSIGPCHDILTTKLEMHQVVSKFVPQLLGHPSKDDNFLNRIITSDEIWVYGYDLETKMQSSQWVGKNSPRPKKSMAGQVECESHVGFFF
jgi:hypothetical protein